MLDVYDLGILLGFLSSAYVLWETGILYYNYSSALGCSLYEIKLLTYQNIKMSLTTKVLSNFNFLSILLVK